MEMWYVLCMLCTQKYMSICISLSFSFILSFHLPSLPPSLPPCPTQLIFGHATESKISYSKDEGVSFTTIDLDPNTLDPTTVDYHPSREGWMLMMDSNYSVGTSPSLAM